MTAERLKEMNPFATVTTRKDLSLLENTYSAVVSGFTSFEEAISLNKLCRKIKTPFYLLSCSGLFGFFFIDVGPSVTFSYSKKATGTEESETITTSQPFEEYLS